MHPQSESSDSSGVTITLELAPTESAGANLEVVNAIGRETVDSLREEGCTFEPIYTGQRGGFLVNVLIPSLTAIWAQKDVILADGSALTTIMTPVVLIVMHLRGAQEKRMGKDAVHQSPIRVTFEIDGSPISIEVPDLETAEDAIKIAERFRTQYPAVAKRVTHQSHIKVTASVPKGPPKTRKKGHTAK